MLIKVLLEFLDVAKAVYVSGEQSVAADGPIHFTTLKNVIRLDCVRQNN